MTRRAFLGLLLATSCASYAAVDVHNTPPHPVPYDGLTLCVPQVDEQEAPELPQAIDEALDAWGLSTWSVEVTEPFTDQSHCDVFVMLADKLRRENETGLTSRNASTKVPYMIQFRRDGWADEETRAALVSHEIGHAAGYWDHSTDVRSVMYPSAPSGAFKPTREERVHAARNRRAVDK